MSEEEKSEARQSVYAPYVPMKVRSCAVVFAGHADGLRCSELRRRGEATVGSAAVSSSAEYDVQSVSVLCRVFWAGSSVLDDSGHVSCFP